MIIPILKASVFFILRTSFRTCALITLTLTRQDDTENRPKRSPNQAVNTVAKSGCFSEESCKHCADYRNNKEYCNDNFCYAVKLASLVLELFLPKKESLEPPPIAELTPRLSVLVNKTTSIIATLASTNKMPLTIFTAVIYKSSIKNILKVVILIDYITLQEKMQESYRKFLIFIFHV